MTKNKSNQEKERPAPSDPQPETTLDSLQPGDFARRDQTFNELVEAPITVVGKKRPAKPQGLRPVAFISKLSRRAASRPECCDDMWDDV